MQEATSPTTPTTLVEALLDRRPGAASTPSSNGRRTRRHGCSCASNGCTPELDARGICLHCAREQAEEAAHREYLRRLPW